ncbi:MAG: recombinase family protein, partial [Candidatus Paceibacteria bacterium]
MGKTYGYARVSLVHQDLEVQINSLKNHGVKEGYIFADMRIDSRKGSDQLDSLIEIVEGGDLVIVKKLERLGRSFSKVATAVE